MAEFKEKRKNFQEALNPMQNQPKKDFAFNPNTAAKEIEKEQLLELAYLFKYTPNENLIAFKDPKVQELINFILPAIIFENERINSDPFPLEVYGRYKSNESLKSKLDRWSERKDRDGVQIPDYLGIRIIPEAEHSILYAGEDKKLKKMIDKNEENRQFVVMLYSELSDKPNMTCQEYCIKCELILNKLKSIFPKEATERRKHYDRIIKTMNDNLEEYMDLFETSDQVMDFMEIAKIVKVNIRDLLSELKSNNPNEVTLYKLKNDLMRTFEQSELLKSLRIICV